MVLSGLLMGFASVGHRCCFVDGVCFVGCAGGHWEDTVCFLCKRACFCGNCLPSVLLMGFVS